jgi:LysM repeat protein
MRRSARALLGVVLLLVLLVGVPMGLLVAGRIAVGPDFLPTTSSHPSQLWADFLSRGSGQLIMALLVVIGLYAWACFAVSVLLEAVALLGKFTAPSIPTLGWAQGGAAVLLGLIVLSSPAAHATASAAPLGSPATPVSSQSLSLHADQLPTTPLGARRGTPATSSPRQPAATSVPTATPPAAGGPVITTVRGDSLWQLAQTHLGNGLRWKEIAALNTDRVQHNGQRLRIDHPILPVGWVLQLPADATNVPTSTATGMTEVTVQPGDTLSGLAATYTGDATRWNTLAEATTTVTQPDGQHLSDPNHLQVGWTVHIPAVPSSEAVPAPPAPPITPPPAPSALPPAIPPTQRTPAPATPSPTPTATPEAPATRTATPIRQTPVNAGWNTLSTYGAVGGMLAAGVLAALGTRRMVQARRRRPGQRLTGPSEFSTLELALRATEDPPTVDLLNAALRTWAARSPSADLPDVIGAVLGSTITLLLTEPATPSSPFMAGAAATQWVLDPGDTVEHDTEVPAPFPTLVTIGRNNAGELVLIDLERAGAITLTGEPDDVTDVLSAMAIELAGSPLADHLDVSVVGLPAELVRYLGRDRLRHAATFDEVLARLEHHHAEVAAALDEEAAASPMDARVRGVAEQAWIPEVVFTAHPITTEQRDRLAAAATGQSNLAAVITIADGVVAPLPGPWVVGVPMSGTTAVPALEQVVALQRLTTADRSTLIADFAATDSDAQVPGPDADAIPPEPSGVATRPPQDRTADGGAAAVSEPSEADRAELATLLHVDPGAPEIQVLGPIRVANVAPYPENTKGASKVLELAVYLVLNPGRSAAEVSRDLGREGEPWADSTRRSRMSQLRTWFGADPSGMDYVPNVRGNRYQLEPVIRSDWRRFQTAATRGLHQGPAGLFWLDAALGMVRGIPFSGALADDYRWAPVECREMINRIADVAHAAAIGWLPHDPAKARDAALRGLRCEPHNEVLYRDLFRAEYADGNLDGVRTAARRLHRITESNDVDMHPVTIELLEQLLDPRHRAAHAAGQ